MFTVYEQNQSLLVKHVSVYIQYVVGSSRPTQTYVKIAYVKTNR